MKKQRWQILIAIAAALAAGPKAGAGIIVDHEPYPQGGGAADTDFVSNSGQPHYLQILADDFSLSSAAVLEHLVFWGFYGDDFGQGQSFLPPTEPETMRARFYASRPADGLPGAILYEEDFVNTSRNWTGRNVFGGHPEYRSEMDLARPFAADAGTPYWLQVNQIGIPDSHYRWEFSQPGDGTAFAFMNSDVPDWIRTTTSSNLAFQLWEVPEPDTFAICVLGLAITSLVRTGGGRRTARKH